MVVNGSAEAFGMSNADFSVSLAHAKNYNGNFTPEKTSEYENLVNALGFDAAEIVEFGSILESVFDAELEGLIDNIDDGSEALAELNQQVSELEQEILSFSQALEQAFKNIYSSRLTVLRDNKGWNEISYQDNEIARLRGLLTGEVGDTEIINQINTSVMERYQAEKTALDEAQQAQQEKYDLEISNYESLSDAVKEIGVWLDDLRLSDLSPMTGAEKYRHAKNIYGTTALKAQANDADAMQGFGQAADNYLTHALANAKTSLEYRQVYASVSSLATELSQKEFNEPLTHFEQKVLNANGELVDYADELERIQGKAFDELDSLDTTLSTLQTDMHSWFTTQTQSLIDAGATDTDKLTAALSSLLGIKQDSISDLPLAPMLTPSDTTDFTAPKIVATGAPPANTSQSTLYLDEGEAIADWMAQGGFNIVPYGYSDGVNRVSNDGLAYIHQDEAIVPKHLNPAYKEPETNRELIAELKAVKKELTEIKALNVTQAKNSNKGVRIQQDWDINGQPDVRVA